MKRVAVHRLAWLALLLLMLPSLSLLAQDAPNPASMAQYFADDTAIFVSLRTDADFVDTLDRITSTGDAEIESLGIDNLTITELIDSYLVPEFNTDTETMQALLGDYAAIGFAGDIATNEEADVWAVVELADSAAFEQFLGRRLSPTFIRQQEGDAVNYKSDFENTSLIITGNLLYLMDATDDITRTELTNGALTDNSAFQDALAALPDANGHNALMYVDLHSLYDATNPTIPAAIRDVTGFAIGFHIENDWQLTLDAVLMNQTAPAGNPVMLDNAAWIPQRANAVIQGQDLGGLLNMGLDATGADARAEFEAIFLQIGIDLNADLLDWATESMVLYSYIDLLTLVKTYAPLADNPNRLIAGDVTDTFDFGLLLQANDPAGAQMLVDKLSALLILGLGGVDEISVQRDTIGDVDVTRAIVNVPSTPLTQPLTFDVGMGVADDVFFLAYDPDNLPLLNPDAASLLDNDVYQRALGSALPNPTSFWYTDAEGQIGFISGITVTTLAIFGPIIEATFNEILDELNTDMSSLLPSQPRYRTISNAQQADPFADFSAQDLLTIIQLAIDTNDFYSVSSTVSDSGHVQLRFVVQYPDS